MLIRDAYYKGTHPYSFKSGEIGKIISIKTVYIERDSDGVLCFHVLFPDGIFDWFPVRDVDNYEILTNAEAI